MCPKPEAGGNGASLLIRRLETCTETHLDMTAESMFPPTERSICAPL